MFARLCFQRSRILIALLEGFAPMLELALFHLVSLAIFLEFAARAPIVETP
jgi:hypothetical protein